MDPLNPFSLANSIFSDRTKQAMKSKFDTFAGDFFIRYLSDTYTSEYFATLAYPILHQRIQNGYYSDTLGTLTEKESNDINKYFSRLIEDETVHCAMLKNLLGRYHVEVSDDTICQLNEYSQNELDTKELFRSLALFYVGECYLWVGFYMIYKETQDPDLKQIFHRFLIDETQHNYGIRQIFKIIKNRINFDSTYYNKIVTMKKYFGLESVRSTLNLPGTGSKQDTWWEQIIFDSKLQQDFNERFIKKCYQGISIFDSTIDYDSYKSLINQTYPGA